MSLITFSCASPSASWSPTQNPVYGAGNSRSIRRHQPKGRCGADIYSYNKGASETQSLRWSKLPTADLTTLLTFFDTIGGAAVTFTYTDGSGSAHAATRLLNDTLRHRHIASNYHEVSLDLEVA